MSSYTDLGFRGLRSSPVVLFLTGRKSGPSTSCPCPQISLYITKPMVLVAYIPDISVSILQTKLSNREGHEARRIGLEAMPLDEHIEGRHGEREPGLK